jgi:hypothetical protein
MTLCKHDIDTDVSVCGDCTPPEAMTQRPDEGWGPWFVARYFGTCAGCDGDIEIGDQIRADGTGGWLCGPCGGSTGLHTLHIPGNLL